MSPPRLRLEHVTRRFPGVLANDDVSFEVGAGEIHALLGENGAGKSTAVKIIYGVLQADEGRVLWEGEPVHIPSPKAARDLGIGMVFQHFSLFEPMSVLENVVLGMTDPPERRVLEARIREIGDAYGLPLDPRRRVYTLSAGERQRIEIVRCLLQDPKLLIMDEPTSVLTPQEVARLFETLRRLAREGRSVLYISHKLEEIRALCDRATVLRQGRVVASADPRQTSARALAEMMIGSELGTIVRRGQPAPVDARPRFEVRDLTLVAEDPFGVDLEAIDLAVRPGEILGIAGVAGNGQEELFKALSGERRSASAGTVRIDGEDVGREHAGARRALGLCAIPEERNGHAAVPDMSLAENAILSAWRRKGLLAHGLLRLGAARRFAAEIVKRFDVRTAGVQHAASSLSGGNLQKFVVGREILQDPAVLIAAQPTWGVDAGAAQAIRQALIDLAAAGAAVLVISQDLDELLEISDRLAVINQGRLSPPLPTRDASLEQIGLLMGGFHGAAPVAASSAEREAWVA
ncbi:MAG TPA: ABC transporter ATP-binding protein [Geminicoccaceae bacterium]